MYAITNTHTCTYTHPYGYIDIPYLYEELPKTETDEVIEPNTERTMLLNLEINPERYEDPRQVDSTIIKNPTS